MWASQWKEEKKKKKKKENAPSLSLVFPPYPGRFPVVSWPFERVPKSRRFAWALGRRISFVGMPSDFWGCSSSRFEADLRTRAILSLCIFCRRQPSCLALFKWKVDGCWSYWSGSLCSFFRARVSVSPYLCRWKAFAASNSSAAFSSYWSVCREMSLIGIRSLSRLPSSKGN